MNSYKKIAIAGSTGYLGSHIVQELLNSNYNFIALGRNLQKLKNLGLDESQIKEVQVTDPSSLQGIFQGIEVVISTVGITRQKDGLTYMDVDYQANKNLLNEAVIAGVKKFIYISAIHGQQFRHLKIFEAKERFVEQLKNSGLTYVVVRPNGFFSDMKDFLDMAKGGRVYLFGHGNFKLNPIHGEDLAKLCLESIESSKKEIVVGGPDILTQNEIAALALKAHNKTIKISHIPDWVRRMIITLLRTFTFSTFYGPLEFFLTLMAQDNIAPRYGIHRLESFFREETDQIKKLETP